jgi:hypothetical protein
VVLNSLHCAGCFGCVFWLALVCWNWCIFVLLWWFYYGDDCSIRILQRCWCWLMVQWLLFGLGAVVLIVIVVMEFELDRRGWWYLV